MSELRERPAELQGLIELLTAHLKTPAGTTTWAVEDFPDKPENYRLSHPNGAVLVQYISSTYGKSETIDWVVQQRQMHWRAVLVGRQQHGVDKGVVTMLNRLSAILPGKRVADCGPITLTRDYFVRQDKDIWEYCLEFAMGKPVIAQPE